MLLAGEITRPGVYDYFEYIGGAPRAVQVLGAPQQLRVLVQGEAAARPLKEFRGCFAGPQVRGGEEAGAAT